MRQVYANDKSRFYVTVKADQLIRTAITKEETFSCALGEAPETKKERLHQAVALS